MHFLDLGLVAIPCKEACLFLHLIAVAIYTDGALELLNPQATRSYKSARGPGGPGESGRSERIGLRLCPTVWWSSNSGLRVGVGLITYVLQKGNDLCVVVLSG